MKILLVIGGLNNGAGTERVCSMIANSLSESSHEILLASIGPCDKPFFPINKDIKIIPLIDFSSSNLGRLPVSAYDIKNFYNTIFRIRNKLSDKPKIIYKIRKILRNERINTVIAVDTDCIEFTLPAAFGSPVKHICWEHFNFNVNQGKKRSKLREQAARYCDAVVTLTERDKDNWLKGTIHQSQIISIDNPCPFPVQEYIKEEDTKTVLAVGRLTTQKGFDMLLEAWIQVIKAMPDWILKIVGEGEDRDTLTEFIKKNDLTDSVELVGAADNVSKYYQQAEIFCLSSRFEGFGVVLIEALAFGLPIVSFDCDTGPAEILKDSDSILVPENNINLLALSLIDLMGNKEQRKNISLKSKEKARIYQPDKIINKWIDLLESI